MLIYLVLNKINGKGYIGQTVRTARSRWYNHCSDAKRGSDCPLHRAIIKYGSEHFSVSILESTDNFQDLDKLEIEHISKHNTLLPNGYNVSLGGQGTGTMWGRKHSQESRSKMSVSAKVKVFSPEHRANIAASSKGRKSFLGFKHKPETITKISTTLKGRTFSPETRAKISAAKMGKKRPDLAARNRLSKGLKRAA